MGDMFDQAGAAYNAHTQPAPASGDMFDQAGAEYNDRQRGLSASALQAYDVNPDQYAQQRKLAQKAGIPHQLMPDATDDAQLAITTQNLQQASPYAGVSKFLANPDNAKAAHDDVPALTGIEKWFTRLKSSVGIGVDMLAFPGASAIDAATGNDNAKEFLSQRIQKFQDMGRAGQVDAGAGFGERFGNAVADLAPYLIMGPAGVPILVEQATANKGVDLSEQGVQGKTLSALSALSGVAAYGMTKLPFGGGSYGKAMAKGAALNVPLGIAERSVEKGVLNLTGYGSQADNVHVFSQDAISNDLAMGLLFGGLGRYHEVKATKNAASIQELVDSSNASKLRERLPDAFKDFVKGQADNGDLNSIGMPIEKFEELYQSTGKPIGDLLTDPTAYEEAKVTGGDVQIPIEDFMINLAPHIKADHVMDLRLRPGDDTLREAQEATGTQEKDVQDFLKTVQATEGADDSQPAATTDGTVSESAATQPAGSEAKVYSDILQKLIDANVPKDAAEKQAALWAIRSRTRAARAGGDAWDIYNERPIDIARDSPNSVSGEDNLWQTAWHGSPHKFDEFKMSKLGSGEGAQVYGHGLYFADARDVAEYYRHGLANKPTDPTDSAGFAAWAAWNDAKFNKKKALSALDKRIEQLESQKGFFVPGGYEKKLSDYNEAKRRIDSDEISKDKGRLYRVDLAPEEHEYLDYDQQLKYQPNILKQLFDINGSDDRKTRDQKFRGELENVGSSQSSVKMSAYDKMLLGPDVVDPTQFLKGEEYLRLLDKRFESPKAVTEYLLSKGVRGTKFLDAFSRGKGKGSRNYVIFDDSDVSITKMYQDKRGYIRIGDSKISIGLLEKADLSTFLHESGHAWLEELKRDALQDGASAQLKADWETIKKSFKIEGDDAIGRDAHEKWADSFEQYLKDGKAPSAELMPLFERFKSWMIQVYQVLKGHKDIKLSKDVRGVMDRMLATDAEIEQARDVQSLRPLFANAESAGMSEAAFEPYKKLAQKASDEAKTKLLSQLMKEMTQERDASRKVERETIKEQVTAETLADPTFQAMQELSKGKTFDGTEMPYKLDKDALVKQYGKDFVKELSKKTVPSIFTKEGGIHQDIVAEKYGFKSGDEMIQKIMETPSRSKYIEQETDRRIEAQHPSAMDDGSIADAALQAVHSDSQGQVLRAELKAINKMRDAAKPMVDVEKAKATQARKEKDYQARWAAAEKDLALAIEKGVGEEAQRKLQDKIDALKVEAKKLKADADATARWMDAERNTEKVKAREGLQEYKESIPPTEWFETLAREHIGTKNSRETKPLVYAKAAAKAARETEMALGKRDFATASEAKRRQITNSALYSEAVKAQSFVSDKVLPYMKRMEKAAAQSPIGKAGGDYLEQIQGILSRYEFSKVPYKMLDERKSLIQYLNDFAAEHPEHAIPVDPQVLDEARQINYREASFSELGAVYDATKAIEHAAKAITKVLKDGAETQMSDAKDELKTRLTETHPEVKPVVTDPALLTGFQKALRTAKKLNTEMTRMEFLIERLDGGTTGPFHDYFWNGYLNAEIKKNNILDMIHEPLKELVDNMPKEQADRLADRTPIYIKSMDENFSRHRLFSILMNLGNGSNRAKLMSEKGGIMQGENNRQITPEALQEMAQHFTKADYDMAQGLWNAVGKLLPEAKELHKRWTGLELETVKPTKIHTPFGDYEGGYWPVKFDPMASEAGKMQEAGDAVKTVQDLFGFTTNKPDTSKGYTIARTEAGYPLLLDWKRIATRHINDVATDIAYREWLDSANRMLKDPSIKRQLQVRGGEFAHDTMEKWLRSTIGADSWSVAPGSAADAIYRAGYSHFTTAVLGLNIAGAFADIAAQQTGALTRVNYKYMAGAYAEFASNPKKLAAFVESKSEWRHHAEKQVDQSIQQSLDFLNSNPNKWNNLMKMSLTMRTWMYKITGNVGWKAAYNEAMEAGQPEADAIRAADKVQRMSEYSGDAGSLSAMERHPVWKKILVYAGPMEVAYNSMVNSAIEIKNKKGMAPEALGKFFAMWMGQSVIWAAARGKKKDDETWPGFIARHAALGPLEAFPVLRDLVPYAEESMLGKVGHPKGLAISAPVQASIDAIMADYKLLAGEGTVGKAVSSTNIAAGMLMGYPSMQMDVTGKFVYDVLSGDYEPQHGMLSVLHDALYRRPHNKETK